MLIVFYVLLVWLKIILGITAVFLWLWVARDRGIHGRALTGHAVGAIALWAAPWIVFLWLQSELYQGHCGLRQGVHDCGMPEFLWTQLRWVRFGLLIDVLLLAGVLALIAYAKAGGAVSQRSVLRNP